MEYSRRRIGKLPLDEFVAVVATIYSSHDKHRTIWDVWSHTLHHAAGIAQQIRMGANEGQLYAEIADFSLWLFTTLLKLNGEFGKSGGRSERTQESIIRIRNSCSDLLWHKYPKLCPLCSAHKIGGGTTSPASLGLNPCDCLGRRAEVEQRDAKRKRLASVHHYSDRVPGEKPTSIDGWQQMFGAIFARNIAALSLADVTLHLMEELGEASDAMVRMYTYKEETFRSGEPNVRQLNLEGQLADVFSRTFVLIEKLDQSKRERRENEQRRADEELKESVRLSEIIWQRYGSEDLGSFYCPHCKKPVCRCQIILVPPTRTVEQLV